MLRNQRGLTLLGQRRVGGDSCTRRVHGCHGSDKSRGKYQRLVAEYARNGFRVPEVRVGEPYRVGELCDEFLSWAEREYRRADGQPTGAVENVRRSPELDLTPVH